MEGGGKRVKLEVMEVDEDFWGDVEVVDGGFVEGVVVDENGGMVEGGNNEGEERVEGENGRVFEEGIDEVFDGVDEDDDAENLEENEDPMARAFSIPEVVEHILNNLEAVSDLKAARCVNTIFVNNAMDPWRNKHAVFKVSDKSERSLKLTLGVPFRGGRWTKNIRKIYNLTEKPFKNYRMEESYSFPPTLPPMQNKLYFWDNFGGNINYLDMTDVSFFKDNLHVEGLMWLFRTCPNLTELKFSPHNEVMGPVVHRYEDVEEEPFVLDGVEALARNLKALTISTAKLTAEKGYVELFQNNSGLCRTFLSWMPNLKSLELVDLKEPGSILLAMCYPLPGQEVLPLQLEKFAVTAKKTAQVQCCYYTENKEFFFIKYINLLGNNQRIKSLELPFNLRFLWMVPQGLKHTLRKLRNTLEELNIRVDAWISVRSSPKSFDLYNLNFIHLKSLTLRFHYSRVVVDNRGNKAYADNVVHGGPMASTVDELMLMLMNINQRVVFSFDFTVFCGTPNLQNFRFETRPIHYVPWLMRQVTAEDLTVNGTMPREGQRVDSWHRTDGEERDDFIMHELMNYVDDEDSIENPTFFDSEEVLGAGLELPKMESFHFEGCLDTEAITMLGRWMPNIKSFKTIFDNTTIVQPFTIWRGIETVGYLVPKQDRYRVNWGHFYEVVDNNPTVKVEYFEDDLNWV